MKFWKMVALRSQPDVMWNLSGCDIYLEGWHTFFQQVLLPRSNCLLVRRLLLELFPKTGSVCGVAVIRHSPCGS